MSQYRFDKIKPDLFIFSKEYFQKLNINLGKSYFHGNRCVI